MKKQFFRFRRYEEADKVDVWLIETNNGVEQYFMHGTVFPETAEQLVKLFQGAGFEVEMEKRRVWKKEKQAQDTTSCQGYTG